MQNLNDKDAMVDTDQNLSKVLAKSAAFFGLPEANLGVQRMPGHASARVYYRVRTGPAPSASSVVVMVLPEDSAKGEEVGSDAIGDELPFVSVQRYLEELGVLVPKIFDVDMSLGLLLLEDMGDTTLEDAISADIAGEREARRLYGKAIDQLAFMRCCADLRPKPESPVFSRSFDFGLLRWELDHFLEWLLVEDRKVVLKASEKKVIEEAFDDIATRLSLLPLGLTHRDYQSRNLMVVKEGLGVIDFQDALMGPLVYDLVALLRDSYVVLDWSFIELMLDRYCDARRSLGGSEVAREELDPEFDLQTVQRKLKDAGRFVFIDKVKNNSAFLEYIPVSLSYVAQALSRMPEYRNLRDVLACYLPEIEEE